MNEEIKQLEVQYQELSKKLSEARRKAEPEVVSNYELSNSNGTLSLDSLFDDRNELILWHNMGKSCPFCTLWADGVNGLTKHFENAAAFYVISPDAPEVQAEFLESRAWQFKMISYGESQMAEELGFTDPEWGYKPGVSCFKRKEDGSIVRTGYTYFGPGDQFCSIWHALDILGKERSDWSPKYTY